MNKNEFLSTLRGRITGSIPTSEVESQIDYYSAYIDGRIGAGLTEEEAVAELGDPQLIAKTVIESTDRAAEAAGYDGKYRSSTDTYDDSDGINSGIFGNSGPSSSGYDQYSHSGSGQNVYQTRNESGYGYGGHQGNPYQRNSNGQTQQRSSGGGAGCIVAVIIFVILMAIGWILTSFIFRLGIRLLGWLFPVLAIVAIIGLVLSMFRRR